MSARVLDLQIDTASDAIEGLGGYNRAFVLLRAGTVPLGSVIVPVSDGRIPAGRLRETIPPDLLQRWSVISQADAPPPMAPPATATVAICTRERPDDLARALAAVCALPDRGGGVLVIDNAPATDATERVVARFPGVRRVVEPLKGLSNARNRALSEAATDIVAFIDDDAVADVGWLDALLAEFRPDVACVAGLTLPLELENDAQEEFESMAGFSKRGFVRREFRSPPVHPLAVGQIGAGANMAVRRALLDEIGPFDPLLGTGTPTQAGEEHDYFSRILRAGKTIVYEPRALNWHRHRRTRDEMLKAVHGYGVGVYAAWTRAYLVDGERGVPRRAWGWFIHDQFPHLVKGLLGRPGVQPLDVTLAELRGCLKGPSAYVRSRRAARAAEVTK